VHPVQNANQEIMQSTTHNSHFNNSLSHKKYVSYKIMKIKVSESVRDGEAALGEVVIAHVESEAVRAWRSKANRIHGLPRGLKMSRQ
jgi:hypothetical protein